MSEILRNKTAFLLDIQTHTDIPINAVELLLDTNLPSSNLQVTSLPSQPASVKGGTIKPSEYAFKCSH